MSFETLMNNNCGTVVIKHQWSKILQTEDILNLRQNVKQWKLQSNGHLTNQMTSRTIVLINPYEVYLLDMEDVSANGFPLVS